jgi:hypothetical protein
MADAEDYVRAMLLQQQRKRECLNTAVLSGFQSAGISLAVAGGLSYSLAQYSDVSACVRVPCNASCVVVVMGALAAQHLLA